MVTKRLLTYNLADVLRLGCVNVAIRDALWKNGMLPVRLVPRTAAGGFMQLRALQEVGIKRMGTVESTSARWGRSCEIGGHVAGGVLTMAMGGGKSLMMLIHCLARAKSTTNPSLIVTNKGLIDTWKREVNMHFEAGCVKALYLFSMSTYKEETIPDLSSYDVVITSYDHCSAVCRKIRLCDISQRRQYMERLPTPTFDQVASFVSASTVPAVCDVPLLTGSASLYSTTWERIVCDESQRISNPRADISKAMMALASSKRWCITGTVMKNGEKDLATQLHFSGVSTLSTEGIPLPLSQCSVEGRMIKLSNQGRKRVSSDRDDQASLLHYCSRQRKVRVGGTHSGSIQRPMDCSTVEHGILELPSIVTPGASTGLHSSNQFGSKGTSTGSPAPAVSALGGSNQLCSSALSLPESTMVSGNPSNAASFKQIGVGDTTAEESPDVLDITPRAIEGEISAHKLTQRSIFVDMNSMQKELYRLVANCAFQDASTYHNTLALIIKLRQISVVPYILRSSIRKMIPNLDVVNPDLATWIMDESGTAGARSPKIARLADLISNTIPREDKVVVFSEFRDVLKCATVRLSGTEKLLTMTIEGSMSIKQRLQNLHAFKTDPNVKVLLCTYKVGAEGHHITEANWVILLDMWWHYQVIEQAVARCLREGQTKPVYVYPLVTKDSVESFMIETCSSKLAEVSKWCNMDRGKELYKELIDNVKEYCTSAGRSMNTVVQPTAP